MLMDLHESVTIKFGIFQNVEKLKGLCDEILKILLSSLMLNVYFLF